jgi:phage tail sheath protein FI
MMGETAAPIMVPPCGHVAGVYARTDEPTGIRKAPANEVLYGVLDLRWHLSDKDQGSFFAAGNDEVPPGAVNCLRAFPGRGIRIWGARTLAKDPSWRYVNVRRLFLTAIRWIEWHMTATAFEPNGPDLWPRIQRELNAYCFELFRRGALKGATTNEAFYVRCDADINPPEMRDNGIVVAEVGLAAAAGIHRDPADPPGQRNHYYRRKCRYILTEEIELWQQQEREKTPTGVTTSTWRSKE